SSVSVIPPSDKRRLTMQVIEFMCPTYSVFNRPRIYPSASNMQLNNEYCIKRTRPVLYSAPMNNTDPIVAQLHKLADKHRLNVAELARMAGLSQPTAHRILSGQSKNPKLENIRALAEALGTTIPELMGGNPALNTNAGPLGK